MKTFIRPALFVLLMVAQTWPAAAQSRSPYSNAEIIDGFNRTVFSSEYASLFSRAYLRRYEGEVRFFISNKHTAQSASKVARFINSLEGYIKGLDVRLVKSAARANFIVHVVKRSDYASTIRNDVFGKANAPVRGRCMVRALFTRSGIARSDAVIVVDEGAQLFSRCMTEEILQGLGPLNDDRTLQHSIFNDESRFTNFRRFDRLILNILYDNALRSGISQKAAQGLLPNVLRRVRQRIEGTPE